MAALFMDLLMAFTCGCLILFKIMLFLRAWLLNFTLYLNENPLNYLLLQSVFQVICKRLVSKRVMLLHLLYHPHRFSF